MKRSTLNSLNFLLFVSLVGPSFGETKKKKPNDCPTILAPELEKIESFAAHLRSTHGHRTNIKAYPEKLLFPAALAAVRAEPAIGENLIEAYGFSAHQIIELAKVAVKKDLASLKWALAALDGEGARRVLQVAARSHKTKTLPIIPHNLETPEWLKIVNSCLDTGLRKLDSSDERLSLALHLARQHPIMAAKELERFGLETEEQRLKLAQAVLKFGFEESLEEIAHFELSAPVLKMLLRKASKELGFEFLNHLSIFLLPPKAEEDGETVAKKKAEKAPLPFQVVDNLFKKTLIESNIMANLGKTRITRRQLLTARDHKALAMFFIFNHGKLTEHEIKIWRVFLFDHNPSVGLVALNILKPQDPLPTPIDLLFPPFKPYPEIFRSRDRAFFIISLAEFEEFPDY